MDSTNTKVALGSRAQRRHALSPEGKNRIIQVVGIAVLVVVLFGIGILAGTYSFLGAIYDPPVSGGQGVVIAPGERITVLFLGIDRGVNDGGPRSGVARSDTLILVSFDPDTMETGVLHLPRDTRVAIPGRSGFDKLGHAHAYGGPLLAMETVSQFLDVPVHYYVRADFTGFVEAVNILGGVEIEVDRDMVYEDPYQDLSINIRAGQQTLDGEQALHFVRYREYPNADIGRIQAQQTFIRAFIEKFYRLNMLWRIPSLVGSVANHLSTDIDPNTMLRLANKAIRMDDLDKVTFAVLPGAARDVVEAGRTLNYWVADPIETSNLADRLVRGIDREANAQVRIRLQDGASSPARVAVVADHLRTLGYMVIEDGNAQRQDYEQTHIFGHDPDEKTLLRLTRALGHLNDHGNVKLMEPDDEEDGFAFTIIVGSDIHASL